MIKVIYSPNAYATGGVETYDGSYWEWEGGHLRIFQESEFGEFLAVEIRSNLVERVECVPDEPESD